MKITRVTVGASRKFNDPIESYANHSTSVTLDAEIGESEDYAASVKILQDSAKVFVDAEHDRIVKQAKDDYEAQLEREQFARAELLANRKSVLDDDEDVDFGDYDDDHDMPF